MAAVSLSLDVSFALLELLDSGIRSGAVRHNFAGPQAPLRRKLPTGTGAGYINVAWMRSTPTAIAASGNQDFDLTSALTDSFGTTLGAATKLVALLVVNLSTTGSITLRAASATTVPLFVATGTQPGIIIPAAVSTDDPSFVLIYAPSAYTMANGATDLINILNNDGGAGASYRIGFAGRTA